MPELPEVETVVRDLRPLVVGRTILMLKHGPHSLRQPWQAAWTRRVRQQAILSLSRRGKWIIAALANDSRLLLHLGMTGQLTVHEVKEKRADHVHLRFAFDDGSELRFRDVRRFGSATWFADDATLAAYLDERLGPEPFDVDAHYFREQMAKADRPLKAILLDQTVLAGVGNIYADEACHRAGLHPGRRANTLSNIEAERLRLAIEAVLLVAIEGRGSTIRDYIGGSGLKGTYQDAHHVYGRTGQPCRSCGTAIVRERIAGRSSHSCTTCQKIG